MDTGDAAAVAAVIVGLLFRWSQQAANLVVDLLRHAVVDQRLPNPAPLRLERDGRKDDDGGSR